MAPLGHDQLPAVGLHEADDITHSHVIRLAPCTRAEAPSAALQRFSREPNVRRAARATRGRASRACRSGEVVADAGGGERVDDRVGDRGERADGASLARTLDPHTEPNPTPPSSATSRCLQRARD